jgi:hypothetical protein
VSSGSYATKAGFRQDMKPADVPPCETAGDEPRGPGLLLSGLCTACGRATICRDDAGRPRHRPA